jgi:hypothetical protein
VRAGRRTANTRLNAHCTFASHYGRHMVTWGSVGEWVSGIGGLAAVGATVGLWWRDRSDRIAAQDELRQLRTQESVKALYAQARSVRLWARHSQTNGAPVLFLWNGSERPIFDVIAVVGWPNNRGHRSYLQVKEQNLLPTPIRPYRIWLSRLLEDWEYPEGATLHVDKVYFADANGASWQLDANGRLMEKIDGSWRPVPVDIVQDASATDDGYVDDGTV